MLNHYFQGCPSSQCHGTGSFLSHPESQGTLPVPRDKKSRSSEVVLVDLTLDYFNIFLENILNFVLLY